MLSRSNSRLDMEFRCIGHPYPSLKNFEQTQEKWSRDQREPGLRGQERSDSAAADRAIRVLGTTLDVSGICWHLGSAGGSDQRPWQSAIRCRCVMPKSFPTAACQTRREMFEMRALSSVG